MLGTSTHNFFLNNQTLVSYKDIGHKRSATSLWRSTAGHNKKLAFQETSVEFSSSHGKKKFQRRSGCRVHISTSNSSATSASALQQVGLPLFLGHSRLLRLRKNCTSLIDEPHNVILELLIVLQSQESSTFKTKREVRNMEHFFSSMRGDFASTSTLTFPLFA